MFSYAFNALLQISENVSSSMETISSICFSVMIKGGAKQQVISFNAIRASSSRVGDESFFKRAACDEPVQFQFGVEGFIRFLVFDKFNAGKEATSTNITHEFMVGKSLKGLEKIFSLLGRL